MKPVDREVVESPIRQGEDERIPYKLTTTPWGTGPSLAEIKVKDITLGYVDVTIAVTQPPSGPPTIAGDVITMPVLFGLERGHSYRAEFAFWIGTTKYEPFAIINCEQ